MDDWIAVVYSSDATTTAIAAHQLRDLLCGSAASPFQLYVLNG